MLYFVKKLTPLFFISLFIVSCAENTNTTEEKTEIKSMDSTSKVLKDNTSRLEDQTKKVEASLEKLDAEFDNDN
jgi:hypothetical protein